MYGCVRLTFNSEEEMRETKVKPSIGRIVIYNHPGSADGTYPPTQSPAMIQKVYEDDTVDLWVFGPKGLHKDGPYKEGEGPCQWQWPTRV